MNNSVDILLKKAQQYLRSAAVLYELADYDSCASRSYFAMFFAAQAAFLADGHTVSRDEIRQAFRERFVEKENLPERAATAFDRVYTLQEMGDYTLEPAVSEEEATWTLQESEAFVNSLTRLVEPQV
jgi:uncharacterized protein (UPF0332 family)